MGRKAIRFLLATLGNDREIGVTMDRKLTGQEISQAAGVTDFPPILTPEDAAKLLQIKVSTLYRHVSEGRYNGAVKRGKPLRFWRDRLIQEFMR